MRIVFKIGKRIIVYIAILLVGTLLALGALLVVYTLPTDRIYEHVGESLDQFRKEGDYFSIFNGMKGVTQDNYSDAVYLNQAMVGNQEGTLYSALTAYIYSSKKTKTEDLIDGWNGVFVEKGYGYKRFWNGWLVPLKLFLLFTNYGGIRYFNLVVQSLLVFVILKEMSKQKLDNYRAPFLLTIFFMHPINMGINMVFAGFYYIILISVILMLRYNKYLMKMNWYGFFFTVMGMATFYFDMNYFQLTTIGLCLVLYFILNEPASVLDVSKKIVGYGAAWLYGFAGIMLMKWVLYAFFVNNDIFLAMYNTIKFRTDNTYADVEFSRLEAVGRNIAEGFSNPLFWVIEISFVLYAVLVIFRHGCKKVDLLVELFILMSVTAAVMIRYILLANHVYLHCWVMYRNLAIIVFAANSFLAKMLVIKRKKEI